MSETANPDLIAALRGNWQAEMQDCEKYQALADQELNARRRNVLRGLAAAERHHAGLWAGRINALGYVEGPYRAKPVQQGEVFRDIPGVVDLALRRLKLNERRDIGR